MPKTASQTAFCNTASRQVNAVSTNSTANARPAGISSYRRKAPNVTSINIASAVPCSGKLMPGRLVRMRQAQLDGQRDLCRHVLEQEADAEEEDQQTQLGNQVAGK